MPERGLLSTHLRPGHPDFLDLPWTVGLEQWEDHCARYEALPHGESRHPVVFVAYDSGTYAIKELAPGRAAREYDALGEMESRGLPVVTPIGHVAFRHGDGERSALITRYLDYCLPYHALFLASSLARYQTHLLDAMAGLLVQLHLAGVYWGDCSLYNTLFLRDAGTLQAWLVDAETSELHASVGDGLRAADLELMEHNVAGGLMDLVAAGALRGDFPAVETAEDIRRRYQSLWHEVSREVIVGPQERYRVAERVRKLNELGFTVREIELAPLGDGHQIRLRTAVADRSFHRKLLHTLTGIAAQEHQARQLVNEIQQIRANLSDRKNRSMSLSAAAFSWQESLYDPYAARLTAADPALEPTEAYCQLLEHKWILSERARRDVGHEAAIEDLLEQWNPSPAP